MIKFHKVSWEQYEKDCIELVQKIEKLPKAEKPTKIVAICRGGLVAARILSDLLSIPISNITIASYKNLKQEKEPLIDETPSASFNNEVVLLVDEICDTGKTFKRALSYFNNFPLKKIYTLALYTKSHANPQPDFFAKKIDAWIIFPYELRETKAAFMKMYKSEKETNEKLLKVGFKTHEVKAILS